MKQLIFVYNASCKQCIPYKINLEEISHNNGFTLKCYDIHDEPIDTILFILSLYEGGHNITQLPFIYDGNKIYEGVIEDTTIITAIINENIKSSFL